MMTKARASSYQGRSIRRGLGIFLVGCLVSFMVAGNVPPPVTSVAAGAALASPVNATNSATGFQSRHQVAVDGIGNSIVVWEDNASGSPSGWSIMGRCFDTAGTPLANAFQISSASASGAQRSPAVARNSSGDFIVAWEDYNGSSNHLNHVIQARWFTGANVCNAGTAPLPFVVRTAGSEVHAPAVAMSAAGNAVIFWNDLNATPSGVITGAGYAKNATSASWLATIGATGLLYRPAVSADKAGNFVVAWAQGSNADLDIYMQGFTSAGSTLSGASTPILVNTTTTGVQDAPSVSMNAGGDFVVAWQSDVSGKEVQAQRFHLNAVAQTIAAQGTELTAVLPATSHSQFVPSVAIDYAGNFWTAWQDVDSSGPGVSARWYNASTTTFDAATTRVNSNESNAQVLPSAAADADGDLLVAWTDQGAESAGDDVYVRRFAGHESVDLSISTSDAPQPALSGAALNYTLTVTNNHALVSNAGASDPSIGAATGIVLTDTLPVSNATYVSASGVNWNCTGPSLGVVTCAYLGTLAPQATASLVVQVTPTAAGDVTNNALVKGNQFDASFGDNSLADTQTAQVPSYGLSANPTSVSFADTNVASSSATSSVTITNTGNASITITGFVAGGSNGADFSIVGGTDQCTGQTLLVNGTCTVGFKFSPSAYGNRSATETVATSQSQTTPLVIPVSGKGLEAIVSLNPTSLTFGSTVVGSASSSQTLALTNTGNASLTLSSIVASSNFSQTNDCPLVLTAGSVCTITVSFVPSSGSGALTGSVTILSSASSSPDAVDLSGTAVAQDSTPNAFFFTNASHVELGSVQTSNSIVVTGINIATPISIGGDPSSQYQVNGGSWISPPTTVVNGDSIVVRHTASMVHATDTSSILSIGGVSATFTSTTRIYSATPLNLAAVAGNGKVTLTWSTADGATTYRVYQGTSPGGEGATPVSSSNDNTTTISPLANGATYYFIVKGYNAATGFTSASNEASAVLMSAPLAPANFTATAGNGKVTLNWSASANATTYRIYQGSSPGGEGAAPVTSSNGTSAVVSPLANGATYYFTVKAYNSAGFSPASAEVGVYIGVPPAPGNFNGTPSGPGKIAFSWDAAAGATTYRIYQGSSPGGEGATAVTSSNGTTGALIGLTAGNTYYFTVKAYNSAGFSVASSEIAVTLPAGPPPAPTGLVAMPAQGAVILSWNASNGATTYRVYRGTSPGGEGAAAYYAANSSPVTVPAQTTGILYYYTVKAYNSEGFSAASNEASATPN